MMRCVAFLAACLTAFVLVGCAKPYEPPYVESFPDAEVQTFPGIQQLLSTDLPLRVLWVHGMCPHKEKWAAERATLTGQLLGGVTWNTSTHQNLDGTTRATYRTVVDGAELEIDYVIWSELTRPFNEQLKFDNPTMQDGALFPDRATLNDAVKSTVMNLCLVDAVVYSGSNGDDLRDRMREEVCVALGGTLLPGNLCDTTAAEPIRLAIVAESLGSKLAFDAARFLWKKLNEPSADAKVAAMRASFEQQLGRTAAIYLISNQIPLLDPANPIGGTAPAGSTADGASESSLGDFLEIVTQSRMEVMGAAAQARGLPVIAFTDPNDLLSYRLMPQVLHVDGTLLVNMLVSNGPAYFDYVERPDDAHCGYAYNPYVLGALIQGYDEAQGFKQNVVPKPSSSCLSE